MREHVGGSLAQCWATDLAEGLADDVPDDQRAPLPREEIAVA